MEKKKNNIRIFKRFFMIGGGIFVLLIVFYGGMAWNSSRRIIREKGCNYEFINPARCDDEMVRQVEYSVFKNKLIENLKESQRRGDIIEAAFYFRDLSNGPIFYYNEQIDFAPMSLLKLPMMIAVFKIAEKNPEILQEKIRTPDFFAENVQMMDQKETLEINKEYTIEDLIRRMIIFSDNRSMEMLGKWLDLYAPNHKVILDTMTDLGIYDKSRKTFETITVKQYISLFRILYNATYLTPEFSEKALAYLAESNFQDGLTGDLPKKIKVAHKFGVLDNGNNQIQLHDCGIVYNANMPYMLCIMTRGSNYEKLSTYIKKTSEEIYSEVSIRAGEMK